MLTLTLALAPGVVLVDALALRLPVAETLGETAGEADALMVTDTVGLAVNDGERDVDGVVDNDALCDGVTDAGWEGEGVGEGGHVAFP